MFHSFISELYNKTKLRQGQAATVANKLYYYASTFCFFLPHQIIYLVNKFYNYDYTVQNKIFL